MIFKFNLVYEIYDTLLLILFNEYTNLKDLVSEECVKFFFVRIPSRKIKAEEIK